jgi:glutaredoxin-like YruB-family protein
MENINSHSDFLTKSSKAERSLLLLYKSGSEQCNCAVRNIEEAMGKASGISLFSADVATVRDIHPVYGIETVPALLIFTGGRLSNVIKGCQGVSYYKALAENTLFRINNGSGQKALKRVTVYSTPACSWCNTLKTWLSKNSIAYTDIDVSRDQAAAEALVRRSGQQGVPQTDINGQIVVGFNQTELRRLLEIQ